jgi:hypothetical protein
VIFFLVAGVEVKRALDRVVESRWSAERFPIIISQDCLGSAHHAETKEVLDTYVVNHGATLYQQVRCGACATEFSSVVQFISERCALFTHPRPARNGSQNIVFSRFRFPLSLGADEYNRPAGGPIEEREKMVRLLQDRAAL